jgi:hypothetical protein
MASMTPERKLSYDYALSGVMMNRDSTSMHEIAMNRANLEVVSWLRSDGTGHVGMQAFQR